MAHNPNGKAANPWLVGPLGVAAAATIDEGNLVMVLTTGTGNGNVQTGAAATANMRCLGWSMDAVDNSAGAAGAKTVGVSREPRYFAGKAGDLPTAKDIGATVYVHDGLSIKLTADGSNPVAAGKLRGIKGSLYLVEFN